MSTTQPETGLVAGTWNIDPVHSEVSFVVRHLVSKVRGTFSDFSGTITTHGADPTDASVSVAIKVASVSTNNEMRDNHIRSADILGAEAHPEITFTSTAITKSGDGYTISGDLTINGITKPVDLAAEFLGVDKGMQGETRLGAEASTTINRKDFNVDFNVPLDGSKVLLGDNVQIFLNIEAVLA